MAGKMVHFEVLASDADRSTQFYSSVFGWQFGDSGMPGIDYRMTQTGDDQGGAVYTPSDGETKLKLYFDTDDIDATIAKIREGGGQAEDKMPIPGIGWFAPCKDPDGIEFQLFQSDESAPMPEGMPQG